MIHNGMLSEGPHSLKSPPLPEDILNLAPAQKLGSQIMLWKGTCDSFGCAQTSIVVLVNEIEAPVRFAEWITPSGVPADFSNWGMYNFAWDLSSLRLMFEEYAY